MQAALVLTARDKAAEALGVEIPDDLWEQAYAAATRKLAYIIDLYGDLDGFRRSASYLGQLAQEYISAKALSAFCAGRAQKKTASEEDGLHDTNSISEKTSKCQTEKECAI